MGAGHSSDNQDKVEKLFRQNVRSSRSRSLDVRTGAAMKSGEGFKRNAALSQSVRYKSGRRVRTNSKTQYDTEVSVCTTGLSRIQKRNLDLAWARTSERQKKQLTEDIFLAILNNDAALVRLFRLCYAYDSLNKQREEGVLKENFPWNRIRTNDYFRSHSSNFLTVLHLTITNLADNLEQVCDALQVLGYQHVVLKERGWNEGFWAVFESVFSAHRPDSLRDAEGSHAWNVLIAFMLRQMKIGFRRGENEQRTSASKHSHLLAP